MSLHCVPTDLCRLARIGALLVLHQFESKRKIQIQKKTGDAQGPFTPISHLERPHSGDRRERRHLLTRAMCDSPFLGGSAFGPPRSLVVLVVETYGVKKKPSRCVHE